MPSASELPHSWLEMMAGRRGCRWSRGNVARSCPRCPIPAALGHERCCSCAFSEALPVAGRDRAHLSQEDVGAPTRCYRKGTLLAIAACEQQQPSVPAALSMFPVTPHPYSIGLCGLGVPPAPQPRHAAQCVLPLPRSSRAPQRTEASCSL